MYVVHSIMWHGLMFLLKAILYLTTVVLESQRALVHHVIPLIDMLTTTFDKVINNESEHKVICHAALRGLLMLNKYYARTDDSLIHQFVMSKLPVCLLVSLWP
jgi:hypothetical protein